MESLPDIVEFHGQTEGLLLVGEIDVGVLDFLDVEEHPPLAHSSLLAHELVPTSALVLGPGSLVRRHIDQRVELVFDIDKFMLGHNELVAQIAYITRAGQVFIKVQRIADKLLAPAVQVMDQFHNEVIGDQLADLLPREEEPAQLAHGLVGLLLVLDRDLLAGSDVPDTA